MVDTPSPRPRKKAASPKRKTKTPSEAPGRKPRRAPKTEPAARKAAILDAALHVFAERGFEAARLDDVAERASVAKGTLYLYFKDKETLFEEVVRSAASPVLARLGELTAKSDLPFDRILDTLYDVFVTDILGTERKLLIRLVLTEGPRFPRIAEFYYRNVVGRVMPMLSTLARREARRGTLPNDSLARYPQLFAAPLLTAVIWDALFAHHKPLNTRGFLKAYRELIAPSQITPSQDGRRP